MPETAGITDSVLSASALAAMPCGLTYLLDFQTNCRTLVLEKFLRGMGERSNSQVTTMKTICKNAPIFSEGPKFYPLL